MAVSTGAPRLGSGKRRGRQVTSYPATPSPACAARAFPGTGAESGGCGAAGAGRAWGLGSGAGRRAPPAGCQGPWARPAAPPTGRAPRVSPPSLPRALQSAGRSCWARGAGAVSCRRGAGGCPRLPRASPAPRPRCPPRGGEHVRAGAPLVGRDGTGRGGGGGVSAGKGRGEPPRWRTLPSAFLFVSVKVPDVPSETRSEAFGLNAFTSLETRLL